MKLLGLTKSKINKDKNGKNVPHLAITKVVLIHCNIVNNDYQQDSRVLNAAFGHIHINIHIHIHHKSFGQLLDISPKNFIFLITFNSEFSYIEVWFTDQNSKPLEIEDRTSITLVID